MQLAHLRYFLAVAEEGHFTHAADQVRVSQPALSKQIRVLEAELGVTLFSRARGHVSLTDAGEALLPLARRILADVDTATREVQELATLRRGRVRLGATPSLCTGLLPGVLRDFHRDYPGIQLIIEESGSRDLTRLITDGALDLALVVASDASDATGGALAITTLANEELVVASPITAPPPGRASRRTTGSASATRARSGAGAGAGASRPLRVTDLRNEPMVMFRHGYDLRTFVVSTCQRAGFEPVLACEGGEMDAVLGFVAAGLGVAVVPATVVADRPEFRITPFAAPGLARTIGLAHRRDVRLPRAAVELRRTLLSYLDIPDPDPDPT